MRVIRIGMGVCAIAAAWLTPRLHAQAEPTAQIALAKEAGTLSDKFTGLARVMAEEYDWTPGQGVRSVGDVFNLIVMKNGMLVGTLTGAGGRGGARPAALTDPEKMQEALKTSYTNLRKTIEGQSVSEVQSRNGRGCSGTVVARPETTSRRKGRACRFTD